MDSRISMSFIIIQTLSTAEIGNSCVPVHREVNKDNVIATLLWRKHLDDIKE